MSIRKLDSSAPETNSSTNPGIKKNINITSGNTPEITPENILGNLFNTSSINSGNPLFDYLKLIQEEVLKVHHKQPNNIKKKIECPDFSNPANIRFIRSLEQNIVTQSNTVQKTFRLNMHDPQLSFDIHFKTYSSEGVGYMIDVVVDGVPHKVLTTDNDIECIFFYKEDTLFDALKYAVEKYNDSTANYDTTNYDRATEIYMKSLESFIKYVNDMDVTLIGPNYMTPVSDLFNDIIITLANKQKQMY